MNELFFLALELIAKLAGNDLFGLGNDVKRYASLVSLVAKYGRAGDAAISELRAFTEEIQAIIDSGERVDAATWDELTGRRHAGADAIHEATLAGRRGGTG